MTTEEPAKPQADKVAAPVDQAPVTNKVSDDNSSGG